MANFDSIKIPKVSTTPTHYLNKPFNLVVRNKAPSGIVTKFSESTLPKDTQVILLEHAVGYDLNWSLVSVPSIDSIANLQCYISASTEDILPLQNNSELLTPNNSPLYMPDATAPKFNWRNADVNKVYDDSKRGFYTYVHDTGLEAVDDLQKTVYDSLIHSLSVILKEIGRQSDEEYVRSLQEKYFFFGYVDAISYAMRGCSTLRVLVSLPKKYAHSSDVAIDPEFIKEQENLQVEDTTDSQVGVEDYSFEDGIGDDPEVPPPPPYYLTFNMTYNQKEVINGSETDDEFNRFFKKLVKNDNTVLPLSLSLFDSLKIIHMSRKWEIDPAEITIDFSVISKNIFTFRNETKTFILKNIPIDKTYDILGKNVFSGKTNIKDPVKYFKTKKYLTAYEIIKHLKINENDISPNGQLKIELDKENLLIKNVFFKPEGQRSIKFFIGKKEYFENSSVIDKTSLNYIIQTFDNKDDPENIYFNKGQIPINFGDMWNNAGASIVDLFSNKKEGAQTNTPKTPDGVLAEFVKKYHYPKVENITALPLNLTDCVKETVDIINDIKNAKVISEFTSWKDGLKQDKLQQLKNEGDALAKAISGAQYIDRNFKILLGQDQELQALMQNKPLTGIRKWFDALRETNLTAILAELLRCAVQNVSLEDFQALLEKYNQAKAIIEQFAYATACNPYMVNFFDDINLPKLSLIESYNPNKKIGEELGNHFAKLIKDAISAAVKELLKASLNICASPAGNDAATNPSTQDQANDLLNALNNNQNNPNINSSLNDLLGPPPSATDGQKPENQLSPQDNKTLETVGELMRDFSCILHAKELCNLLRGYMVSDDTFAIMRLIIERKYPEIKNKLSTNEEIKRLFLILGNNVDTTICEDILQNPAIPQGCGCSPETLDKARETLLQNKGLTPEAINDILKDLKDSEKSNLEDIMAFLNSEDPDFGDVPPQLCQTTPDGDVIPPAVNLQNSSESFKILLNTFLNDIYTKFDSEASQWYKTTYSTSGSSVNNIIFDRQTGQFSTKEIDVNSVKNDKTLVPAFLFNNLLQNNDFIINKDILYSSNILGAEQQKLDADIIDASLRNIVNTANSNLKIFITRFMQYINSYINIAAITETVNALDVGLSGDFWSNLWKNVYSKANFDPTQSKILGDWLKIWQLFDNFARDNNGINSNIDERISSGKNTQAVSLYLKNAGASLYLDIADYLQKNRSDFINLIKGMALGLESAEVRNGNTRTFTGANGGTISTSKYLIELLEGVNGQGGVINEYQTVQNIFKVVLNSSLNYPDFNISFIDNYKPEAQLSIPSKRVYDLYKLEIDKNKLDYVSIENYELLDDQLDFYIKNNLGITKQNPKKSEVFNAYLNKLAETSVYEGDENFIAFQDKIFKSVFNSIKNTQQDEYNNAFLAKKIVQPATSQTIKVDNKDQKIDTKSIEVVTTQYLKLVLPGVPTSLQKSCGIYPHYLDIDEVKDELQAKKQKSFCIEEIVNDKIRNNLPVSTTELKDLKKNETQILLLDSILKLTVRVYVHDILLRGIGVFGYYHPQYLKKDSVFIDFISSLAESEMRGIDNTFYTLLTSFFIEMNNLNNSIKMNSSDTNDQRKIFRSLVEEQLIKSCLPKLAKRILDDTNKDIKSLNLDIKLKYNENLKQTLEALKMKVGVDYYLDEKNAVFFSNPVNKNQKIKLFSDDIGNISDLSIEYRLIFEYLFPLKRYISLMFITNVLCTSTRKQILDTFKETKGSLRSLCKTIWTNGQPINPDPANPQDVANASTENASNYWLKALIETPLMIAKGYFESSELNVVVANTTYKTIKMFNDETPDWLIPTVGVPVGLTALALMAFPLATGPAFATQIIPSLALNFQNGFYYAAGLWTSWFKNLGQKAEESAKKDAEAALANLVNFSDKPVSDEDCNVAKDHLDKVKINPDTGYVVIGN